MISNTKVRKLFVGVRVIREGQYLALSQGTKILRGRCQGQFKNERKKVDKKKESTSQRPHIPPAEARRNPISPPHRVNLSALSPA